MLRCSYTNWNFQISRINVYAFFFFLVKCLSNAQNVKLCLVRELNLFWNSSC